MDFHAQLVRREERIESIHRTSGFWPFIILALIALALAVNIFHAKVDPLASTTPLLSPYPTESHMPRVYTVSYRSGVFSPTNLRIHAGDTVRFRNDSFFPIRVVSDPHPAHTDLPGFDSVGDIPQDSMVAFTFATTGTFGYHNEKSIDQTGTIIVR